MHEVSIYRQRDENLVFHKCVHRIQGVDRMAQIILFLKAGVGGDPVGQAEMARTLHY